MHLIMGSSGRDCVLVFLLQFHGFKARLFEGQFFGNFCESAWSLSLHIGRNTNPILMQLNTIYKQPV